MLLWSLYSSTILTKQLGSSLCWLHSVCLEGTRRNFFFNSLENKIMSHCHTMILILTLALGSRSSQHPALFFVSIIHVSLVGTPPADFPSPHTQNTDVTATGAGRPGKIIPHASPDRNAHKQRKTFPKSATNIPSKHPKERRKERKKQNTRDNKPAPRGKNPTPEN